MVAQLSSGSVPLAYAYTASGGSGRLNVPVSPSAVLYANFRHVAGVAAPSGSRGASIDSLKILDALIDRLSSIKREPLAAREAPESLSPGRVDALIEQYASELHNAVTAQAKPYVPSPMPVETGILFTLAA